MSNGRTFCAALAMLIALAGCAPVDRSGARLARPSKRTDRKRTAPEAPKLPPRPKSLASEAVSSGKISRGPEISAGPAEEIPKAPERPPARTLEEAKERALADLYSPNAHLRFVAALEAGSLRLKEAVPALAGLLARDDVAAIAAIRSLGRIGGDAAAQALARSLGKTKDAAFDLEIIKALGRTGSQKALKPLLRALSDRRLIFRIAAARALGELGIKEAAGKLRYTLEESRDIPALRVAAAAALASIGEPIGLDVLEEAASRGGPELQTVAVDGLAALASAPDANLRARASWRLASVLSSPYPEGWRAAFSAIVRLRSGHVLPILNTLEEHSDPHIAMRARLAKAAFGGADSKTIISTALSDADPNIRVAACEALAASGAPEHAELAARALEDPDASVRVAAARALGAIGGESGVHALKRALQRDDPLLRTAAREALASRPAGGFKLEGVVSGTGGEPLCVLRSPEGQTMLLKKGDAAGGGYVVEEIHAEAGRPARVVLSRDGRNIELEAR